MTAKAKKALFKLQGLLMQCNFKPSLCLRLFDQLIKPICLYGSEIWGLDKIKCNNASKFYKSIESFTSEKTNMSFSKFVLGVHKKAQNTAVHGELARFPLGIDIMANIVAYGKRFEDSKTNSLLKEAYALSANQNKSWVNKFQCVGRFIQETTNINPFKSSRKKIIDILKQHYKHFWKDKICSEPKMRSYIQFKTQFAYEAYLDSLPIQQRKSFTRFRISAHNLPIERGRYTRPKLPVEERTCPYCPSQIGNEIHFLTECCEYNVQRDATFAMISTQCKNFSQLARNEKMIFLLNAEGCILTEIAKFIHAYLR